MAANPTDLGVIQYNKARAFRAPVGATALRPGQLAKFSSNVLVPIVDNEENVNTFVVLEYSAASNTGIGTLVVPFADAVVAMTYTGTTPTVGTAYGVTGPATVDGDNTTQLMVLVISVNTTDTTCNVIEYQISA